MTISGKPSLIKKINMNIVLNHIRDKGPISRVELYKISKISKPTISSIIESLLKEKLIVAAGLGKSSPEGGKQPTLYKLNNNFGYIIGSQIKINEIVTIISDFTGNIIGKKITKIGDERNENSIMLKLFENFERILKNSNITTRELMGIGIGLHGVVDHKNGILIFPPHFQQWRRNIPFSEIVEQKYGIKTYIDNYCRMQVCAEKLFGIGSKYENIVTIETGVGLAAGIIIEGDIYRGNNFIAGEIGHTTIDPNSTSCFCGGKGCFEAKVSSENLREKVILNLSEHKGSILYNNFRKDVRKIKIKDIFNAYISGDNFIESLMDEVENYFAIGIGNAILSYDPEIVIIQGDFVEATDKFVFKIKEKINKNIFPYLGIKPHIEMSKLGKYAGPIGSVSLVLSKIINFSSIWGN
jgi:N-acetylglucosamine repressor